MENKQADRSPFEWRENTASERRRMRNQRKKRKRLQKRKGNDECKQKTNAIIDGLARRLRKESEQNRRLLFLARKYYLKWRTNKDLLIREKSRKPTSTSRFGTQTKFFSMGGSGVASNVSEIEWDHLMSPKDKEGHEI